MCLILNPRSTELIDITIEWSVSLSICLSVCLSVWCSYLYQNATVNDTREKPQTSQM